MLVLYVELEAVDTSKAREHVLGVDLYLRVGDVGSAMVDLVDHTLHIIAFALALTPLFQFQSEVTVGRGLFEVVGVTSDERVDTQLRQVLDTLLHLF